MARKIFLSITILSIASAVGAADLSTNYMYTNFQLSIYEDAPGAQALMSGDHGVAISKARTAARLPNPLPALTTLCAAYITTTQLGEAEQACEKALDYAKQTASGASTQRGRTDRAVLAKAYSNRAVLRALQGDNEQASRDLRRAKRLGHYVDTVTHNLEILQLNENVLSQTR